MSPDVVDRVVLRRLERDLGSGAFVQVLVHRYRAMLVGRVRRVQLALQAEDHEDTLDAVLSLKASSAMVGARLLEQLAADLDRAVRRLDLGSALAATPLLATAVEHTDAALAAYLAEAPGPPAGTGQALSSR